MASSNAEKALLEARALVAPCLLPWELCALACAGGPGSEVATCADWASWCTGRFGAECAQYLQYLGVDMPASWRALYLRLQSLHHRLRAGPMRLQGATQIDLWPRTSSRECPPRLLQGGHSVIFWGDEHEMHLAPVPGTTGELGAAASFQPSSFLDVAPLTPMVLLGVTHDLRLECWQVRPKHGCERLRQAATRLEGDASQGVRVFVEHVASCVFVFIGRTIHAFDVHTLWKRYHLEASGTDGELSARWDYGQAFLAYRQDSKEVLIWFTQTGQSLGRIEATVGLLFCDLTHTKFGHSTTDTIIVATLEIDGLIRMYENGASSDWRLLGSVSPTQFGMDMIVVEVKLQGQSLLAASHSEHGNGGRVHVWDIGTNGASSHRSRWFTRPPDKVEFRHGGALLEVCFAAPGSWPMGVLDLTWLDPTDASLRTLLQVDHAIGDWRCDIRDSVAVATEGARSVQWYALWPRLESHTGKKGHHTK